MSFSGFVGISTHMYIPVHRYTHTHTYINIKILEEWKRIHERQCIHLSETETSWSVVPHTWVLYTFCFIIHIYRMVTIKPPAISCVSMV